MNGGKQATTEEAKEIEGKERNKEEEENGRQEEISDEEKVNNKVEGNRMVEERIDEENKWRKKDGHE